MHHPQNLDSARVGAVKDQNFLKSLYWKNSHISEFWMFELRTPTHLGLFRQTTELLVSRVEKSVAGFGGRFDRQLVSLIVEVLIRLRT
jgi:hypothetical protein